MTVLVGVSINREESYYFPDSDADKINLDPSNYSSCVAGSSYNVARALQGAGISVMLAATIADDVRGAWISAEMARLGQNVYFMPWRRDTNFSISLRRGGKSQLVCVKGDYLPGKLAEHAVIEGQVRQIRPRFRVGTGVQIADAPVIHTMFGEVLDDEGNLINSTNVLNPGISLLEAHCDPETDFRRLESLHNLLQRSNILVVNQKELQALLANMNLGSIRQLQSLGAEGSMKVLVTKSSDGAILFNGDPEEIPVSAFNDVEVVDPVGAGDCFLGYFIAGLMQNASVHQALEMASAAAAITVGRVGGSNTPKLAEVQEFLQIRRTSPAH
ncbi:MAG: PfkB family carbohydrate kinase [Patescibacteria group bacterium]